MRGSVELLKYTLFIVLTVGCDGSGNDTDTGSERDSGADAQQRDAGSDIQQSGSVIVTGPVTGGKGKIWMTTVTDLEAHGYTEKEYFFEGDASSYTPEGEMTSDGKWTLVESEKTLFKTRLIVRQPVDAGEFNGTVVVEWLNVSGGTDADPGFMYSSQEILREGYAWVGVSAQEVGVQGGGFAMVGTAPPLKEYDPERYGSLVHPGDAYSYDIFTRAAQIVRAAGEVDILEGLEPVRLIAYGESQSAGRLVSYVNGVHPLVREFDGFFIHSRFASSAPFGTDVMQLFSPQPTHIRDDIEEPVLQFETESDVLGSSDLGGFRAVRQPDTERIRTWEVAGTAHADAYILELNSQNEAVAAVGAQDIMSLLPCEDANEGPQHMVVKAALHALNLWITDGTEPPIGEPLELDANGSLSTDEHGNALGGIRTPAVDVPIATLKGRAESGDAALDMICALFGQTIPFTPEKLLELYPTHQEYVDKVIESARLARQAGFILPEEEASIVAEASAASIPQ